jgi:hypothetical protein
MIVLATSGETVAFLVIGVLGIALSVAVFRVPALFDAATRMRLRSQGLNENDEVALRRDRERRRFIAMVLGIGSAAVLIQSLTRL